MGDEFDKAQAGNEARERMVKRAGHPSRSARGEALRRYLSAEQYRRRRERDAEKSTREHAESARDPEQHA
jgi:hypothetical protein